MASFRCGVTAERVAVTAAVVTVGALTGVGIVYLALIFGGDRLVDF